MIEIAYDIKDEEGVSEKDRNLKIKHAIKLGSLVEVNCDYLPEHGIRLFVVDHTRDCDGTPLYSLSFDKDAQLYLNDCSKQKNSMNFIDQLMEQRYHGMISNGWSEDSLIVIK